MHFSTVPKAQQVGSLLVDAGLLAEARVVVAQLPSLQYSSQLLLVEGRLDEAIRGLQLAFGRHFGRANPGRLRTARKLAEALTRKGDTPGAIAVLEAESNRRVALTAGISPGYEWPPRHRRGQPSDRVGRVGKANCCCCRGPGTAPALATMAARPTGDSDGTTVILNANREMRASLYSARFVRLDFSQGVAGTALCGTDCFWDADDPIIMTDGTVMQTNVVDATGNEVTGGLISITDDQPKLARFFFTFDDPRGRDFHWSLRYYPELYPGTDYAHVTRTAECTWTIQSQGAHRRGLIAYGVRKGKDPSSKEGIFVMPFELTFTAPGCTQ